MAIALNEPRVDEQMTVPAGGADSRIDLTLNELGVICACDIQAGDKLGYGCSELAWRHISTLLPELAGIGLMRDGQINPRLRFLSHIGHRFQLVGLGGEIAEGRLFLRDVENHGRHDVQAMIFPVAAET